MYYILDLKDFTVIVLSISLFYTDPDDSIIMRFQCNRNIMY